MIKNSNFKTRKKIKRVLLIRMSSSIIVKTHHPYGLRFPFMLKYMEALLQRDLQCQVRLTDCLIKPTSLDELLKITNNWLPDLIVIFSTTRERLPSLKYASMIKKIMETIIVGVGQDVTASPEKYLYENSPIDIILPGEAELELVAVVKKINFGTNITDIGKCYLRRRPITILKLDELPFLNYDSTELKKYNYLYPLKIRKKLLWGHILTSRGCPYSCIFCSQAVRETYGKELRLRSASGLIDEIEYLTEKGANIIAFDDDNFTTSKEHVISICNEIQKRNLTIKWIAHARVDNVSFDLLKAMHKAGCLLLRFGVESGSGRVLKILKKTDSLDWIEKARRVFRFCKEIGIDTVALFLVGNPTETKEEILESIKLAKALQPDMIQISFFTLYPGSRAANLFKETIKEVDTSRLYHYLSPLTNYNLSNINSFQLQRMYKTFYAKFLLNPKFIIRHFTKYASFYLHNPQVFLSLSKIGKYLIERGNGR